MGGEPTFSATHQGDPVSDSSPENPSGAAPTHTKPSAQHKVYKSSFERPDEVSEKGAGPAGIKNLRAAVETIRSNQGTGGISGRPSGSTGKSLILIDGLIPIPIPGGKGDPTWRFFERAS